jgi:ribonuclease Z
MELKIPKGPVYAKLKAGETVTLNDGRIIEPFQVVQKSEQEQHFAIICDIKTNEVANSLSLLNTFNK